MFTCKDYHLFIYSNAKRSIRAQNCWITPWWWITAIVHEDVLLYPALGLWYPFLYIYMYIKIYTYIDGGFSGLGPYIVPPPSFWADTSPVSIEDSQRNQPSQNLKIFYWYKKKLLNHYQYMTWRVPGYAPERMAWISKQPTMSCQRPGVAIVPTIGQ